MEEKLTAAGVQVEGTFDVQRFFETLAMILSRKENLSITVKVHRLPVSETEGSEAENTETVAV